MAKSTEEQLEQAIGRAAELAEAWTDGKAESVTFDLAASGEVPFRVTVPDETLPLVGLVRLGPRRPDNPSD